MRARFKFALWVLVLFIAALALPLLLAWMLAAGLPAEDQAVLRRVASERLPMVLFVVPIVLAVCAGAVGWLFGEYVLALVTLREQVGTVLGANPQLQIASDGAREVAELAAVVNRLAAERRRLQHESEARVREASGRLAEERNRLAALMSELTEGVLVCNAEGRILLYNERARQLGGGATVVGLGRSLFGLIDREQVAHAREKLERTVERGSEVPVSFVTGTGSGRLLKVRAAPVLSAGAIGGMVLTLEDVTGQLGRESQRLALLQELAGGVRAPVANLRAAAENLATYPDMETERRRRFVEIIAEESRQLSRAIDQALRGHADALTSSLALEDMSAVDLIGVARRHLESGHGAGVEVADIDEALWLRVDSFAMIRAFAFLWSRLREERDVQGICFAARKRGAFVELDVGWRGPALPSEALAAWEGELRDVLERHGAELWLHEGRAFRFLLPAGEPAARPARAPRTAESRPEYYDFDLFRHADAANTLQERPLAELTYTVFDTETTGLEPSAGDEIISFGAVRIVNARLLKSEVFERLVDPRRPLNPASARVHGIEAAALAAEPGIEEVLPAFHRFCEDTVLVAHNAAFDMRFLELKEAACGVRFTHPVLDTLLLSAAVHPSSEDHRLEAIAERLGVQVIGRHTALGDALLAGEIFLRLLPLLAAHGIVTLGQALQASRETYYSRLRY